MESPLTEIFNRAASEHISLFQRIQSDLPEKIYTVATLLATTLAEGRTIFWCGNGGSASDSQHIAAEFVGRFRNNRRPLAAVSLNTDTSVLTCIANDFGYEHIFSRQVEALGKPGDVLMAISTSGRSPNVLEAIKAANRGGLHTIGLLGASGGEAMKLVHHALLVESSTTARIQEAHIFIGHLLCEMIEKQLHLD
jgi:D-sedoheptulose 7-phosphate isomerase